MKKNQSRVGRTRKAAAETAAREISSEPSIPAILFEGDEPEGTTPSREAKYSSGAAAPALPSSSSRDLPEAYGTGTLLLLARDPHTLYAHWDLTRQQQEHHAALTVSGRLTLRVHSGDAIGAVAAELVIEPGTQHRFVSVPAGGTSYLAELGYSSASQEWVTVSTSGPARTPPATVSSETEVQFGTVPGFGEAAGQTGASAQQAQPAGPVPTSITATTIPPRIGWIPALGVVPKAPPAGPGEEAPLKSEAETPQAPAWGPEQERALAELLGQAAPAASGPSSFELAQTVPEAISSPLGGMNVPSDFWLNVDADLVVYGATEPNARVAVAGSPVELRADGSFACRFALPDGEYDVTIDAVSREGDSRKLRLRFQRRTVDDGGENSPQPAATSVGI